ncbi:hypothetical protein LINGRAPRIM_LOCUS1369 [Linum grandiflorum]
MSSLKEVILLELLAIRNGLSLARSWGYKRVHLESDSLDAIKLIEDGDLSSHPFAAVVYDIKKMIGGAWSCKISHTMREGNKLADLMANLGHESKGEEETLFANPPTSLIGAWKEDKAGRMFMRP